MAGKPKYNSEKERIEARNRNERNRRLKNPEKFKEIRDIFREKNKERYKEYYKEYYKNNKERIAENRSKRYYKDKKDRNIRHFKRNIRSLIYCSFVRNNKNFRKKTKTESILGCTVEFLCDYLIQNCKEKISLSDFGFGKYTIDHIIPLESAKTEEDVIKLCHYTNLQALRHDENIRKSNKIVN